MRESSFTLDIGRAKKCGTFSTEIDVRDIIVIFRLLFYAVSVESVLLLTIIKRVHASVHSKVFPVDR